MAGGFSCSFGHTWEPREGQAPSACPICGDRTLIPMGSAVSLPPGALVTQKRENGVEGLDLVDAPTALATLEYKPEPGWNAPPPKPPSFSSLGGIPDAVPVADSQATHSAGDVVPFAEAVDYVPPAVPGYDILGEVGRGGMGVVYKARQLSLNRPVALKMILAGSHAGARERERFRREAEAVATLQNPHIVQIFEIGESNGHLYLALEFVEGGNLAQNIKKSTWAAREAAELVELLARAVHYAHLQGVVHRDLKPGNVLLQGPRPVAAAADLETTKAWDAGKNGESAAVSGELRSLPIMTHKSLRPEVRVTKPIPKITDFGLAKRLGDTENPDGGTKTGAVMGTPSYIAPEQASGKTRDVGPSVDIYALGAILYELLTGRPPFMGETPLDTVLQVLNDDPVPPKRLQPTIPRDLETICLKCLTKSPAKRYLTADALADDLRRFILGEPIKARPLSAWGRGVKWARRHPSMAILGTFTVLATIALVSVLSVAYAQVKQANRKAKDDEESAKIAARLASDARDEAERLARQNAEATKKAIEQNKELMRVAERTRRAAFALQLAQIAAICERDPSRARELLENEVRCPPDLRDFTWNYFHRLCQREERVYTDQPMNQGLNTVAYAPNGKFVATAGASGEVRVWDPRTGKTWAILTGSTEAVTSVAFSLDSGVVAGCGGTDRTIRLWSLPQMLRDARDSVEHVGFFDTVVQPMTLTPDIELTEAHDSGVNCLAFSPDGESLVSGGDDGYLNFWNLNAWRVSNPLMAAGGGAGAAGVTVVRASRTAHPVEMVRRSSAFSKGDPRGVVSLAFAASGKVLIAGCKDGRARLFPADGSHILHTTPPHSQPVLAVAANPDGRLVAVVNNGPFKSIRLFETTDKLREVRRLTGHTGAIYGLAMSPDGELLASAGWGGAVRIWKVEDGQELSVLQGHELTATGVAFAPDRRTLVSTSFDGTARVWHTTARPFDSAETFQEPLSASALSADGATLIGGDNNGQVQAYYSDSIPVLSRPTPGAKPFYFSRNLDAIVTEGDSPRRAKIRATATTPNGQLLVAATSEPILFVWQVRWRVGGIHGGGLGLISKSPIPLKVPLSVYSMTIDPTGRWLATLDSDGVRVWDLHSLPLVNPDSKPVVPEGPGLIYHVTTDLPRDLVFHPKEKIVAIAHENGVRLIDFNRKVVAQIVDGHLAPVETLAFGHKPAEQEGEKPGLQLATADNTGLIKVWTVEPEALVPRAELSGHTGLVYSLAFSPDGRTLASGGEDRTVNLWDPMTGQERAVLPGHADRILRVKFVPDASALLTVGRDGAVKRWRVVGMAQPQPAGTPKFNTAPWGPGLGRIPLTPALPGR